MLYADLPPPTRPSVPHAPGHSRAHRLTRGTRAGAGHGVARGVVLAPAAHGTVHAVRAFRTRCWRGLQRMGSCWVYFTRTHALCTHALYTHALCTHVCMYTCNRARTHTYMYSLIRMHIYTFSSAVPHMATINIYSITLSSLSLNLSLS